MSAATRNSSKTTFTKNAIVFLVLCFYYSPFYKCFNLMLLLTVSLLAYIDFVEAIIRVTRYCLERHLECSTGTLYPTCTRAISSRSVLVRLLRAYLRVLWIRLINFSCLLLRQVRRQIKLTKASELRQGHWHELKTRSGQKAVSDRLSGAWNRQIRQLRTA